MNKKIMTVLLIGLFVAVVFILSELRKDTKSVKLSNQKDTEEIKMSSANDEVASIEEITLDSSTGKTFNVPIVALPDLKMYLDDAMDLEAELERIQVEHLDWNSSDNNYFILKYGCGNKLCDLVFVQIDKQNNVRTVYLTNGSFAGSEVLEGKAMLRIAVNEGASVARHQMFLIDLQKMDKLFPLNENDKEHYFNVPLYPITEFKWLSEKTIELVVADITDTSYEWLEKWYEATNPAVKKLIMAIEE